MKIKQFDLPFLRLKSIQIEYPNGDTLTIDVGPPIGNRGESEPFMRAHYAGKGNGAGWVHANRLAKQGIPVTKDIVTLPF